MIARMVAAALQEDDQRMRRNSAPDAAEAPLQAAGEGIVRSVTLLIMSIGVLRVIGSPVS